MGKGGCSGLRSLLFILCIPIQVFCLLVVLTASSVCGVIHGMARIRRQAAFVSEPNRRYNFTAVWYSPIWICLYCAGMDSVHARACLAVDRKVLCSTQGTQLFCLVQGSFFGIRLVVWCCGSFHGTIGAHEAHSTLFQELMGLSVGGVVLRCCCGVPFSLKMMD